MIFITRLRIRILSHFLRERKFQNNAFQEVCFVWVAWSTSYKCKNWEYRVNYCSLVATCAYATNTIILPIVVWRFVYVSRWYMLLWQKLTSPFVVAFTVSCCPAVKHNFSLCQWRSCILLLDSSQLILEEVKRQEKLALHVRVHVYKISICTQP